MAAEKEPAYNYCALPLASYACRPDQSKGRLFEENESETRTVFQRDRDRIIHSSAFRRLKYKTQVFVYHQGDHFRTRLSHTLEVAQIARSLARALMINEDLAEAVALAHDLGHTPFAHSGEDILAQCMEPFGGFEHNDQSLRVVTYLEHRYPKFRGINLSWESLEGIVKHNGPVTESELPITLKAVHEQTDLILNSYASLEAQAAAIADDIAYNNHDVEDGLRAGMFTLEDLMELSLLKDTISRSKQNYPDIESDILTHEIIREMIGAMIGDVLSETRTRLQKISPETPDDIRNANMQIIAFSDSMEKQVNELREFLFSKMYHHFTVNRIRNKAELIVADLFRGFLENFRLLPPNWQKTVLDQKAEEDETALARIVSDYIAGMTDRYAIREHERLYDLYWDLR